MKPKVNYGLWVIMMCHCRFINCNKVIFWYEIFLMGEAVQVWGKGSKKKSLYLPPNFF